MAASSPREEMVPHGDTCISPYSDTLPGSGRSWLSSGTRACLQCKEDGRTRSTHEANRELYLFLLSPRVVRCKRPAC